MENERYPLDLIVSAQDFLNCGWKEVLEQTSCEKYSDMRQAFSASARSAMEEGRKAHGKVLWLLADACSMMLVPTSQNDPFKPYAVFPPRRSVIPDDLADSDISFFSEIIHLIDDAWLKARISDLCWLKKEPKVATHALEAIDAYRTISLDKETWVQGGQECWKRAISLTRMLKAGAGDRLQQLEATILEAFDRAVQRDGFLGLWLADLLKTNGMARERRADVANRLESLAREFDGEGDLHRAREYFSAASDWYGVSANESKATEMTVSVAEGWVKEAIAQTSLSAPSHMVAASFYENAIQTYRTIPRMERAAYGVDQRTAELRTHLSDSGEKALGEMGVISTPSVDISEIVENARNAVSGKSPVEALEAFANLHQGARVEELRKNALDRMGQFPLQSLFAAPVMSGDGLVIAKRPAMSFGGELTDSDETAIRTEMIRDYGIFVGIVVIGDILPALETMLLEHRLREQFFVDLARQSPIVPKGREGLFGKALFQGYERDFVSALYLLIPQIEHMVRFHLKQAGAKTTNLDKDGIENENGLSTLMDLPEAESVFRKDLAFELRTLFCDAIGPNLRNELAHGLLDEEACLSPFAIYAWWLGLRLTFITWWNAARANEVEQEGDSDG